MKFFKGNSEIRRKLVVSIQLSETDRLIHYALVRKGDDGGLARIQSADSLDEIPELKKKIPVTIHLHGFGVLTRLVENVPNFKDNLIVSGDKEDFYFASHEFENSICVSFLRKSLIEDVMTYLKEQKIFLFELTLGPVPLMGLKDRKTEIHTDYKIAFRGNNIVSLEKSEDEVFSNRKKVYWEALALFSEESKEGYQQALDAEELQKTQTEYREYKRFVALGIGILAVFLVALSANYFYVNHLNQKSADLEAEIYSFGESLSMMDRLEQEKERKVVLLQNSGIQTDNFISFYLDDIGASVPPSVDLEMMEVFPLIEPLKPKRKVEIDLTKIMVKGWSSSSKTLERWMETLEEKDWIGSVELLNYFREDEAKANFQLLLKIKN